MEERITTGKFREVTNDKEAPIRSIIIMVLMSFIGALFIRIFIISVARVDGISMGNTLMNNDKLIMEKVSPKLNLLKKGDIISFNAPDGTRDVYIKRIIGVPGDIIEIKEDGLYFNNVKIKESYLRKEDITHGGSYIYLNEKFKVKKGTFFVMGDNRMNSSDSRDFGLINQSSVVGHAIFRFYPFTKISGI